jgi:RNA polymerase sigma-70 factor (ECF subfamily)
MPWDAGGSAELPAAGEVLAAPAPVPLVVVESFDSFYLREYPQLVSLARALTGSRDIAEDLAQESLVVAYRRWEEICRLEHPAAYVRRLCANRAVSTMRRHWAEARALVRLGARRDPLPELGEATEDFWAEVRRLPRRQAQAVALFYGCDLTLDDVAAAMDSAPGTVKSHLHRARQTLATRLGVEPGDDPREEVGR